MGFPRQEYWSGLPFPSLRGFPDSRIELLSQALQADSLPLRYQEGFYSLKVKVAQSCPVFVIPWTAVCQASLSSTSSWSLLKLMSIELVMPHNHLLLCPLLLLLLSIFPSIRVMCQLFPSAGQSSGASASTSVLPINIQD